MSAMFTDMQALLHQDAKVLFNAIFPWCLPP
jgi:hypothetical protein